MIIELPDQLLFAAVFDGHGEFGHSASGLVRELMVDSAPKLFTRETTPEGVVTSFKDLFAHCQAALEQETYAANAGATASCVLIDLKLQTLTSAHVGDSTVRLVRGGSVVYETQDHKFDEEAERRIERCGGEVKPFQGGSRIVAKGTDRPGLAMSRSLGDVEAAAVGLISEPTVSPTLPFVPGSAVIAASDGVWDVIKPLEVAAEAASGAEASAIAFSVVSEARSRWQQAGWPDIDDITAIVVKAN